MPIWPPQVKSIEETLDFILANNSSLARFGDGEMDIIAGYSIPYKDYHPVLAERLKSLMFQGSRQKFVVCLSDVFDRLERYNGYAAQFWKEHLRRYENLYRQYAGGGLVWFYLYFSSLYGLSR